MLKRTVLTTLLAVLACAPAAAAAPRAHSAAEQRAEDSLAEAEQLLDGRGVRTGRELSPALLDLAKRFRHLRGDARKRAIALLSRPTDADAPPDERYSGPEAPPLCDDDFCVHFVATGEDAPAPGMPALALAEANAVRDFENGTLAWREPPADADGRIDIYLKELSSEGLFGFAAPDANQADTSQHSYLVIDDDFDPAEYGGMDTLEALRMTLAHEYAHVLQYGYDVLADRWHFESSAVWMEQRMYPAITDWLGFLHDRPSGVGWGSLTELPLTYFEPAPDSTGALDPRGAKAYGDVVWNQFLSSKYGSAGDALQRGTWERSNGFERASTAAYDRAIRAAGGLGLARDFAEFSAAVAEWQVPAAPLPTPADVPDVERVGALRAGRATSLYMHHLTFALFDVPATDGPIRLAALFPPATAVALALVAREGSAAGGEVTTKLLHLPEGGAGKVTIREPEDFYGSGGRITAVLVNADASHEPFWDERTGDWPWSRDAQPVTVRVSADTGAPRARLRGLRLRSRDRDPLKFEATLRQDGRIVGKRSGRIRPGSRRRLRFAGADAGRARLVVRLVDPSGNTKRLARTLRLGA